jgi:hypothetical protein
MAFDLDQGDAAALDPFMIALGHADVDCDHSIFGGSCS